MIKANEYRLGIIVMDVEPYDKIYEVDINMLVNAINGISYRPIPLTPEWLERCGFEYHMPYYIFKSFIISENRIRDGSGNYDGFHMTLRIEDRMIPMVIRNLHQLQNLYFALTGEELNVKL